MKGRVIKSTGSWYEVDTGSSIISSRLKGKFKKVGLKLTNPIAVGDWVEVEVEPNQNTGVIRDILQRENYVIRKSTRKQHFSHIIASNVDQAILMITMQRPKTSFGFIDRFLVSIESFRVPGVLVINKIDQMEGEDAIEWLQDIHEIYEPLGYKIVEISALNDSSLEDKWRILRSV